MRIDDMSEKSDFGLPVVALSTFRCLSRVLILSAADELDSRTFHVLVSRLDVAQNIIETPLYSLKNTRRFLVMN